jgi:hypothetical protein
MDKSAGEETAQNMLNHASIMTTRIYLRKDIPTRLAGAAARDGVNFAVNCTPIPPSFLRRRPERRGRQDRCLSLANLATGSA